MADILVDKIVANILKKAKILDTTDNRILVKGHVRNAISILGNRIFNMKKLEEYKFIQAITQDYIESLYVPGTPIGIQSTTNTFEKATQASLKTIHQAGVASSRKFFNAFQRVNELINGTKQSQQPLVTLIPKGRKSLYELYKMIPDIEYNTIGKFIIAFRTRYVDDNMEGWYGTWKSLSRKMPSNGKLFLELLFDPYTLYKYGITMNTIYSMIRSTRDAAKNIIGDKTDIFYSPQAGYRVRYDGIDQILCQIHIYAISGINDVVTSNRDFQEEQYLIHDVYETISNLRIKGNKDYIKAYPESIPISSMLKQDSIKSLGNNRYSLEMKGNEVDMYGITPDTVISYIRSQFPNSTVNLVSTNGISYIIETPVNLVDDLLSYTTTLDTLGDIRQINAIQRVEDTGTTFRLYPIQDFPDSIISNHLLKLNIHFNPLNNGYIEVNKNDIPKGIDIGEYLICEIIPEENKLATFRLKFIEIVDTLTKTFSIVHVGANNNIYVFDEIDAVRQSPIFLAYKRENEDFNILEIECEDARNNNKMYLIPTIQGIDPYLSYSNNINEIYDTLGIDAVYEYLMKEISMCIAVDQTNLEQIINNMVVSGTITTVNRMGLFAQNIGPLSKSSFETNVNQWIYSSLGSEVDPMSSVPAQIMVGGVIPLGSGSMTAYRDIGSSKTDEEE